MVPVTTKARLVFTSQRYSSLLGGLQYDTVRRLAASSHRTDTTVVSWSQQQRRSQIHRFRLDQVGFNLSYRPAQVFCKQYHEYVRAWKQCNTPLTDEQSKHLFGTRLLLDLCPAEHKNISQQAYKFENRMRFDITPQRHELNEQASKKLFNKQSLVNAHIIYHKGSHYNCYRGAYKDLAVYKSKYREKSHNSDKANAKNFIVSLGFMGLFEHLKTSDNEEERAILSDDGTVKKMKPLDLKIAKGILFMYDQDYAKANEFFHEGLRIAQDNNDEEKENLILNLIASNFFDSGDHVNAEKLFIEIMKRLIAEGTTPTDPPILELSLKLASIYGKNQTTFEKASKGFKFVIDTLHSNLAEVTDDIDSLELQSLSEEQREQLALLGWSYDWFAKYLLTRNDYNTAVIMLQRALQISTKILGPLHDQTLILLNDVGTTLAMVDSPEQGLTFLKKAVEGALESQSKELASFYVNLGLVNLTLKELQEAKRYCEYSVELASKNPDHYNSQEVLELSKNCLLEVKRLFESVEQ